MSDQESTVNQVLYISSEAADSLTPAEQSLHNNFLISVQSLRKDLVRTAYYLLQVKERHIHKKLGFADLAAYAAKVAGLTRRQTEEFVGIARKLPQFQEVAAALREGRLSWSQARLIARRAQPEEQRQWIEKAQTVSVRQLADALPSRRPAGPPPPKPQERSGDSLFRDSTTPPVAAWCYFTLRFSPEQYALMTRLLEAAAGGNKEEKILNALAASGGQSSSLPYLLVIMHCPECGKAALVTNRGEIAAAPALLAAARCDAAIEDAAGKRRKTIPPRLRRLALQRARFRCEAAECSHTQFLEVHHRLPIAAGGGHTLDNLVVLCSRCHRRLHESEAAARSALRHAP